MPIEGRATANATSTALEASRVIKSAPGSLYRVSIYNGKAGSQYIQLHNASSLPADTAVPVFTFQMATLTTIQLDWDTIGRYFDTGIVICNSSTAATKTLGSADCFFDAQYT